jgi:hypothetical protein
VALRCNTDVSLLLNGGEANSIAFYITDYITKKAKKQYHGFEFIRLRLALEHIAKKYSDTGVESAVEAKRRINRILHQIAMQQEKSAIEVATLCLGLPEHYHSDTFQRVFTPPLFDYTRRITAPEGSILSDLTVTASRRQSNSSSILRTQK